MEKNGLTNNILKKNMNSIVKNLTFSEEDVKQVLRDIDKRVLAIRPVVLVGNSNITLDPKRVYYGNLYSRLGVTVNFDTKTLAEVQGANELEVLFDELVNVGNDYKFFGYQLTIQQ